MRYLQLLMLVAWPLFMSKTALATELAETMALYAEQGQHNRIQSPFNGVMLVAKNNNILLKKAYGFYDKERNKRLETNSKFLIGSVTKQFTAMLVLQQVALGNIELDKNVSDYLPLFQHGKAKELTIHRLLTHTSGLPHYEGLRRLDMRMEEFYHKKFTPKSYAQLISKMKLINQPGSEFYYSSFNYILLGAILEQVTGQTYQNLLEHHIIKPLGLKNTGYANNQFIEKYVAKGYQFQEFGFFEGLFSSEKGRYQQTTYREQSNTYSTGGMYSSVEDLYRWTIAIQNNELLSKELSEKMLTAHTGGYGYGWFINHEQMLRFNPFIQVASHSGALDGYAANIALYKDGTTVIYLSNVTPVGHTRLTMNMHLVANGYDIDDFVRDIKFPNINDGYTAFVKQGGMSAVREYMQEISRRAGYQVRIIEWGYQELIKLHLEAEKNQAATALYEEMLVNYTTPSKDWLNQIGYDFLEHKHALQAIKIFRENVKNHHYSASAHDSLGDAYKAAELLQSAQQSYAHAVRLASKNGDKHLAYYQQQLADIDKKIKNLQISESKTAKSVFVEKSL